MADEPRRGSSVRTMFPVLLAMGAAVAVWITGIDPARAAFPGQNGLIALTIDDGNDDEILVVDPTTGATRPPLTNNGSDDFDPVWSPDGTRIAFTTDRLGSDDIWVMDSSGGNPVPVTEGATNDGAATWSPDGTKIAFQRDLGGGIYEVFVVSATGGPATALTTAGVTSASPSWSPDGTKIAFLRAPNPQGSAELFTMDSGGGNEVPLTSNGAANTDPSWSPDGQRIVFKTRLGTGGDNEIYVMPAVAGGTPTPLTDNTRNDASPTFSPDGTTVLFQATTPTGDRLFRVPSTGGADVSLGINRPPERFADWQRIVAQPGGGAGPGPAQPSAGLGGLAVTSASFRPRWRVSRLGGSLVLGGDVARPVLLEAVVVGAGAPSRALLSRRFRVTKAGRFKARVPIAGLLPGSYLLRVRDVGGATPKLAAIERPITLAAPREGVVARAWISTSIGGTPRRTIAKGPGILFANVRFAALPARGLPRRVTWYWSGMSRAIETTAFPRALRVTRFVRRGGPLPSGSYRAELTAGGRLIAVVRARIR